MNSHGPPDSRQGRPGGNGPDTESHGGGFGVSSTVRPTSDGSAIPRQITPLANWLIGRELLEVANGERGGAS